MCKLFVTPSTIPRGQWQLHSFRFTRTYAWQLDRPENLRPTAFTEKNMSLGKTAGH